MLLSQPTGRIRRTVVLLAVTGLAIAGLAGVSESSRSSAAAVAPPCAGEAHQRVRGGPTSADPNSVSNAAVASASNQLAAKQRRMTSLERLKILRPSGKITISVYVHAITQTKKGSNGRYLGWVPSQRVTSQIAVLNAAYAAAGFEFVLATAPATKPTDPWPNSRANDSWYSWSDTIDDGPAKRALHRGGPTTLNLYLASLGDDLLGYATFPWDNEGALDGVVVLNTSVPGGGGAPYDRGDTAVHEVGHWLGLFHTFQGACGYLNDAVTDTPAQYDGQNVLGCDTSDDTCSLPGLDPVRNFMSYGDDACLTNFTAGQGFRMRQSWYSYRAPYAPIV